MFTDTDHVAGPGDERTSLQYFSTLECHQIRKLANIYLFDFILFEYDFEQYYKRCM